MSGMTGDCHVPFCGGLGVRFPWATRLCCSIRFGFLARHEGNRWILAGIGPAIRLYQLQEIKQGRINKENSELVLGRAAPLDVVFSSHIINITN